VYRSFGKRTIDLCIAIPALFFSFPILLISSVSLYFANHGKIFFFQERGGLNGKTFIIFKFKTMTDEKGEGGILLPDNQRLTKVGRLIRRASLDELLQLVNVIKGEMSLIGPRPLLVQYLPLYNDSQKRRHDVRPGITGLAQIKGRNQLSWDKKFAYDLFYVQNLSFGLDLMILLQTILIIISGRGVSSETSETMELFTGSEPR